jgi:hypothetical protein
MENKLIVFLFPSTVFSGHEKMAIKILEKSPYEVSCILNEKLVSNFTSNNQYLSYSNFLSLIKTLIKIRIKNNKVSVILIAGSPYGFLLEKIFIKILFFSLIDYVPVPELKIIQDRFYHKLMPFLNRLLIDKRLLIDDWQKKYSTVKKNIVIKNII